MRHRLLAVPAAAVIVLATALPALAFGTTPDASYGTGGTVSLPNGSDGVTLVQHGALTYDAYSFFATNIRTVLERRDSTGALDPTFGTGGQLTLAPKLGQLGAMAVGSGGDVYLATMAQSPRSHWHLAVVHITADGIRDAAYGTGGRAVLPATAKDTLFSVSVDDVGNVGVAGVATHTVGKHLTTTGFVMRVDASGTLDTAFGVGGRRDLSLGRQTFVASARVVGSRTLVAGDNGNHGWVLRLRGSGALDHSYGTDGITLVSSRAGATEVADAVPTSVGTVVVAQLNNRRTGVGSLVTVHLTDTGAPDTAYSGDGRATLPMCPGCNLNTWTVADDGTVAVGGAHWGRKVRPLVGATLPSGLPDTGISATGWAFTGPAAHAFDTAIAIDGTALLVASFDFSSGPNASSSISRYLPNP